MTADLTKARAAAWKTRRRKYGAKGHNSAYGRGRGACQHCERMRAVLVRLHAEGVLSEGQAAKATGLDRIELRTRVDTLPGVGR